MPPPKTPLPRFGDPLPVPTTAPPTLKLLEMHAAAVEPRQGGPLMAALAAVPFAGLQHVKRVRKQGGLLQVLLCRADWRQNQQDSNGQGSDVLQHSGDAHTLQQPQDLGGGGTAQPDLPPAVVEIVQQQGLTTFMVQVRRR